MLTGDNGDHAHIRAAPPPMGLNLAKAVETATSSIFEISEGWRMHAYHNHPHMPGLVGLSRHRLRNLLEAWERH